MRKMLFVMILALLADAMGNTASGQFKSPVTTTGSITAVGPINTGNKFQVYADADTCEAYCQGDSAIFDATHKISFNTNVDFNDSVRIRADAGAGKVFTSDENGYGTWQTASGGGGAWNLTGNAGTIPGTDFIGTTDDADIVFKRNTRAYGYFGTTNIAIGDSALFYHGSGDNNVFIGYEAGKFDAGGASNNIGIGRGVLYSNQETNNTAIGDMALHSNTTGASNVALGGSALYGNLTGTANIAIGSSALSQITDAGENVVIGVGSATQLQSGTHNIAIGNGVQFGDTSVSYAISIGYESNAISNQLAISDSVRYLRMNLNGGDSLSILANDGTGGAYWKTQPRRFVATIEQTGTSAPTITNVLENTFGCSFTFVRFGVGQYQLAASDPVFTTGKTVYTVTAIAVGHAVVSYGEPYPSNSSLSFETVEGATPVEGDRIQQGSSITVIVYP